MPCAWCGTWSAGARYRRVADDTAAARGALPHLTAYEGGLWILLCEACLLWADLIDEFRWGELGAQDTSRERERVLDCFRRAHTVARRRCQEGLVDPVRAWHQSPGGQPPQDAIARPRRGLGGPAPAGTQASSSGGSRGGGRGRPFVYRPPWQVPPGGSSQSEDDNQEGWGRWTQGAATAAVMGLEMPPAGPPPGATRVVVATPPPAPAVQPTSQGAPSASSPQQVLQPAAAQPSLRADTPQTVAVPPPFYKAAPPELQLRAPLPEVAVPAEVVEAEEVVPETIRWLGGEAAGDPSA